MPIRDWAAIRKTLIANYNPKVQAQFGATPSASDQQIMNQMLVQLSDSSLMAQSRIQLFNQQFPPTVEAYAAVPEWWQIRIEGNRPQMIFLFAQILGENSFDYAKYPITIPHPIVKHYQQSPLPNYQKGQYEGIVTLKDNSKIIINAFSNQECEKIIEAAKKLVIPDFLVGATEKIAPRKGPELSTVKVSARSAKYFSTGLKNVKPDWIDKFK